MRPDQGESYFQFAILSLYSGECMKFICIVNGSTLAKFLCFTLYKALWCRTRSREAQQCQLNLVWNLGV